MTEHEGEEEARPVGKNWEELVSLSKSPHGRLQLRSRGLLQGVLDALKTTNTVEKALNILVDLCKDCDCALELAQRGLHGSLNQLLKSGEQGHEEAVYLAIQAASEGLPFGHTFPVPRGLPDLHPALPHAFCLCSVTVVARSETSQRLLSQEDVGQMLWPAARVLSNWLLRTAPGWLPTSIAPIDCRLLELGAGIGLTGLAAAQIVGLVCLTDFQPAVLANLNYNAALVGDSSTAASTSRATALPPGHTVDVSHLDWMKLADDPDLYDVIIGSDIVCSDAAGEAAAAAVAHHLAAPHGRAYFLLPPPHVRFGVASFLDSLVEQGLEVETVGVSEEDLEGGEEEEEVTVGGGYEASLLLHSVRWA